ncbi:hypothetical protein [Kribbella deserti]|uniref:DUF3558 domain-containing protein n=1 Tax=Kribbella deserti TaxID=1926257 RepID=A0ABV6QTA2_9ACTN
MSAVTRTRSLVGASLIVVVLAAASGCGDESAPAAQPSQTPTSTPIATPTPSTTPSTPNPSGTPSMDCPQTIASVRAAVEQAVWGKGAPKSAFQPVSVTICQYDAEATGKAYATVTTKRQGKQAEELLALINAAKVTASEPKFCTKELGPTYALRFTDNERGVLTYTVEAYGCRRLVATSFEGQGKPGDLASPRIVTPQLIKSLGQR